MQIHRVVFPGITRALAATFWPNYVYEQAVRRPRHHPRLAQRGLSRGIRLDNELKQCTSWMADFPRLRMTDFLKPDESTATVLRSDQLMQFNLMRKSLQAATLRIIHFLHQHDLVFYQSQLPVASLFLDMATSVDLVCQHKDDRGEGRPVVLIEIKCGWRGYYEDANGMMRMPYNQVTNCPKNQHQLQLTLTRWMYQEDYKRVHGRAPVIRKAFVLRTDTYETIMYEQEAWTGYLNEEYRSLMFEALLRWRKQT